MKVSLTADDMAALLVKAQENPNGLDAWVSIAAEWIKQADKEIVRLKQRLIDEGYDPS